MGRLRVFIVLALALTAGGVFAFGTSRYLKRLPTTTASAAVATTSVVTAARDLEVGTEIKREDVRTVDWPSKSLPNGAISNPDQVIGRGLVMPMIENEPFLSLKLASKEAGVGLPPVIPSGFRALSVKVNEVIGVAGYVLPGTHVDVVVTVSPTQNQNDMTSKVILANVQVLAAGTRLERETDKSKPVPVTVVTLLVDPEQAERLTLGSTQGKIQLALRNPLDKEAPPTPGVRPAALLAATKTMARPRPRVAAVQAAPVAPPADPDPVTVEIIRGGKRAREVVRQEQ